MSDTSSNQVPVSEEDLTRVAFLPLPYQQNLVAYLKKHEAELWRWFASAEAKSKHDENLKLELLKQTYRLSRDKHPELYQLSDQAKEALGLSADVTLYQAQNAPDISANAFISFAENEAHVVFMGDLMDILSDQEMLALLGHELAHFHFWKLDGGDYEIASRVIYSMAAHQSAQPSHSQSARLYQLYTETYCDRGSYLACGDLHKAVGALVKTSTGSKHADGASYLEQADEVFGSKEGLQSEGFSHPETFIRARALRAWAQDGPDAAEESVRQMIQGPYQLDQLDLMGQQEMSGITRRFIDSLLEPDWLQTESVLAHARQFFEKYQPGTPPEDGEIEDLITKKLSHKSVRDYLAYVLLDFANEERELEDRPLVRSLVVARKWKLAEAFKKIACREMHFKNRQWKLVETEADAMEKKGQ